MRHVSSYFRFRFQAETWLSSKCPICFEKTKQLRKLPVCKHSFCENCMRNHCFSSKIGSENRPSFLCPVCRCSYNCPEDKEGFICWIKTLDFDGGRYLESNESLENIDSCFSCRKMGKSSRAVKHCVECRENYCEPCCDLFHSLYILKDHNLLEMRSDLGEVHEMYQKLNDFLACPVHVDKTVYWICEDHNKLCCQTCAFVEHRKCNRVKELGDHETRDEIDKENEKLAESINELTSYGQSVTETIKECKNEYKTKTEGIGQMIRDARAKINHVFDALEEKSTQTCRTLVKKYCLSDDMKIQTVQGIVDKLVECRALLKHVKQKDSSVLTDVILHKLKEEFNAHETSLLEIVSDIRKAGFELQTERLFTEFVELNVNDTDKLAVINENEENLSLPNYNRRQLLKFSNITKIGTHTILAKISPDKYPQYRNMISLAKNHLMLVDERHGLCCLTNERYNPIAYCNFMTYKMKETKKDTSIKPFSATYMKDNIVLVSVPARNEIYSLRVGEELVIVGTANTLYSPKALHALSSGDIAVSWSDPVAFGILSLDCNCMQEKTYFTQDQSGRVLKTFDYMALDERRSHVIQPCTTDKAVYCFDFKGNPKFTYTHESLKNPKGVGLDKDGNIYVCDQSENRIHIVTDNGIPVRLFREGCPEKPLAITFDRSGTSFVVSQTGVVDCYYTDKCRDVTCYSLC